MGEELRETISRNLKTAMRARGIKQVDIARHMGVSPQSISAWLNGTYMMTIDNLADICRYLGITLNQVAGLDAMEFDVVTGAEARIMRAYREADPIYQMVALELLEAHPDAKNKKSHA